DPGPSGRRASRGASAGLRPQAAAGAAWGLRVRDAARRPVRQAESQHPPAAEDAGRQGHPAGL
ncbi:MAG: hypothetical protein AVDCRST_MAG08-3508, partial [uncultured Acetobacteraceae bacterium]